MMWRNKHSLLGESVACFIFLVALCDAHRFLTQNRASQFLSRHRRANSMFEESKKGNLERECIEELCNKEEAREIFENYPETEHFYPQYVLCLGSHRVGINNQNSGDSNVPSNLRTCVKEISDQCLPFPCYKEGSEGCIDGQASFTCQCRPGWKGPRCEDDIDECSDPDHQAGCNQKCYNSPGSFRCMCDDGYRFRTSEKIHCTDINECLLYPSICEEPAKCVNNPGMYECHWSRNMSPGFSYNFTLRSCLDVDECEVGVCEGVCVNTMGSYSCRCEGRQGLRLAEDQRSCEEVPVCVQLYDYKHSEMLYLGEQFTGGPVIYLRFRLPENTKFAAEFDFRTFDPEGVVLYAESSQDSWFMLGLRGGRIEVQFKTQHSLKVTSGGKAINDGQWHVISVDELESSISVKISKEAVMSINSPESLFTSINGKLETKVYIAGLPNRTDSVIKPINPRLDGCIRGWNLMNQGASGVKEVIQEKKSKHCFLHVERGTYFTGAGLAHFNMDYRESGSWRVALKMHIRPSSSTGVLFALVLNDTVPLSVAVVTQGPDEADLQVFLDGVSVATLQSLMLCYPDRLSVELTVTPTSLEIVANTSTWSYSLPDGALDRLNNTMMTHSVRTCIGGLPDEVPVSATPVTAYYHGCMDVNVNARLLDFDEADSKHNSIKSHSCPQSRPQDTL
ncbi:vitamin K-dependent protein S-like [Oncorhynchus tshawytscha]|uniref:vitamin K-dependent protein S-like n=1 Tax=Oncorhynchus tshawytscha TaxID=74940 RepID=UPI001C3CA10D|nr:vitamin K-dependent protein S-like [Oncorhynchus tshawytscha]